MELEKQKEIVGSEQVNGGILFYEIGTQPPMTIPDAYNHAKLFVIDGHIQATINGESYLLQRGDMADIVNGSIRLTRCSTDARAYLLLLTDQYVRNLFCWRIPFSPGYLTDITKNPVTHIAAQHHAAIIHNLEYVHQAIADSGHRFSKDILEHKVLIFFLVLATLTDHPDREEPPVREETDKRRHLFNSFVDLLQQHICREHTVNFYADCLHITPQYLRRIVKEQSGQQAYSFINNFLLREVCRLLLETDHTLQEIADELHFSDQAVLSKFFKRLKGISPLKFRNRRR